MRPKVGANKTDTEYAFSWIRLDGFYDILTLQSQPRKYWLTFDKGHKLMFQIWKHQTYKVNV